MLDVALKDMGLQSRGQPIAEQIWRSKYQYKSRSVDIDHSVEDTLSRVAKALAQPESDHDAARVEQEFYRAMAGFGLVPAGRILSGAGTSRNVTLANTFVMRRLPDSVAGIMDTVKEAALTMQMGGGIGFDFSTLRPQAAYVAGLDGQEAGPLPALDL